MPCISVRNSNQSNNGKKEHTTRHHCVKPLFGGLHFTNKDYPFAMRSRMCQCLCASRPPRFIFVWGLAYTCTHKRIHMKTAPRHWHDGFSKVQSKRSKAQPYGFVWCHETKFIWGRFFPFGTRFVCSTKTASNHFHISHSVCVCVWMWLAAFFAFFDVLK